MKQGRIQDFKLGGAHLKKLRRAEGGAKIFEVFRMKNHDFTPKNHIFSNFRGGGARAGCAPRWIRPCEGSPPVYEWVYKLHVFKNNLSFKITGKVSITLKLILDKKHALDHLYKTNKFIHRTLLNNLINDLCQ